MCRWIFLLLVGCASPPVTNILEDVGIVCLSGGEVVIDFQGCLSSSCDTLDSAVCDVTGDAVALELSGTAQITSQGDVCTTDCGFVTADCDLPTDVTDATTVSYAGETTTLGELDDCF